VLGKAKVWVKQRVNMLDKVWELQMVSEWAQQKAARLVRQLVRVKVLD
jgi:hypothetical protein